MRAREAGVHRAVAGRSATSQSGALALAGGRDAITHHRRRLRPATAVRDQFERGATEALENRQVFQTPEVKAAGGLTALQAVSQPAVVLRETKQRMFAA